MVCYINWSQNQAGDSFLTYRPSMSSIHFSCESPLKFGFWNAIQESVDYIHHSVVQTELTTPQRFLENQQQPKIARA